MEIDNEDQLLNYMVELEPELKARFELLYDGPKYNTLLLYKKGR